MLLMVVLVVMAMVLLVSAVAVKYVFKELMELRLGKK
jgi:hypothetical protein